MPDSRPSELPLSERAPATLSALCRSPMACSPEGLELARRMLSRPRAARYLQGVGRLLYENGDPYAPPRATRLAAELDRADLLELLIRSGAWLSDPRTDPHRRASSPLHLAAQNGSYESVKRLLMLGADPNEPDENSNTALHLAARHGHAKLFPLLCAFGANPNASGWNQVTPLIEAFRHCESEGELSLGPIDALLALGADINQMDDGMSLMHYAASDEPDSPRWIHELLARGAKPDEPGMMGTPLLSLFLDEGDISAPVTALLNAGANPDALTRDGFGAGDGEYANPYGLAALAAWRERQALEANTPAASKADSSLRM